MQRKTSEVLQINDTSSCAGYSYSRRRPCNNHLSSAKTHSAEYLLIHLSPELLHNDVAMDVDLGDLARFLLCTPRHENQVEFLVETWKRRLLWFQREQIVQRIQEWESVVEDMTVRLEQSSLSLVQPHVSHGPSRHNELDEHRPARLREHYAVHPNAASSSTGQSFTALRADNYVSLDLALDNPRNLDGRRYGSPDSYASPALSDKT